MPSLLRWRFFSRARLRTAHQRAAVRRFAITRREAEYRQRIGRRREDSVAVPAGWPSALVSRWLASAGSRARATCQRNGMPPSSSRTCRPPPPASGRRRPPSRSSPSTSTASASSARRATPSSRFPVYVPVRRCCLHYQPWALCVCTTLPPPVNCPSPPEMLMRRHRPCDFSAVGTVAANHQTCHENAEQLRALQAWVSEMASTTK